MADEPQELLTVQQVADRVKLSPVTVQRWLRAGKLKGVRIGAARAGWRIPAEELYVFSGKGNA